MTFWGAREAVAGARHQLRRRPARPLDGIGQSRPAAALGVVAHFDLRGVGARHVAPGQDSLPVTGGHHDGGSEHRPGDRAGDRGVGRPDAQRRELVGEGLCDLHLAGGIGVRAVVRVVGGVEAYLDRRGDHTRGRGVQLRAERVEILVVGGELGAQHPRIGPEVVAAGDMPDHDVDPRLGRTGGRDERAHARCGAVRTPPPADVVGAEQHEDHVRIRGSGGRGDGGHLVVEHPPPDGVVVAVERPVRVDRRALGPPDVVEERRPVADEVDGSRSRGLEVLGEPVAPRDVIRGALGDRVSDESSHGSRRTPWRAR